MTRRSKEPQAGPKQTEVALAPEKIAAHHDEDGWVNDIRFDVWRALWIGLVLTGIFALLGPLVLGEASSHSGDYRSLGASGRVQGTALTIASVMVGMGLGSLATLFWSNRKRLRSVFRPNVGRVLSALSLAMLVPVALFGALPIPFLFVVIDVVLEAAMGNWPRQIALDALGVFITIALPLSYVAASLFISGVRSKWVRVAMFGQVWLAAHSVAMLYLGCCIFNL